MHDHVDHAVLEQVFRPLESLGQLLPDGLLDHPRAGEADNRPRLGDGDVAEHGEGRGNAAGGRIREHDDVRQARLLDLLHGDDGARQLHQRQDTFLHAGAPGGRDHDERRFLEDRQPGRGEQRSAHGDPHGSAEEAEIEHGDDDRHAAHPAVGDDHGVGLAGAVLRLLEALGVASAVAELQRIDDRVGQLDPLVRAVIEQHLKPSLGAQP